MEKGRSHMTERLLSLTLQIIYLLTGEDYTVVKKSCNGNTNVSSHHESGGQNQTQSPILEPSPLSLIHERDNDQTILELTNKIIQLLTGEVPIRYQDVTVCFSMEEWEYVEGHQDLYKDVLMENHQPLTSLDTTPNTPIIDKKDSDNCKEDGKQCQIISTCKTESKSVHPATLGSRADATSNTPDLCTGPIEHSSIPIKTESTVSDAQFFSQESVTFAPVQPPQSCYSPTKIPESFVCKEEHYGVFPISETEDHKDFDYLYITEDSDTHISSSIESVVTCIECFDHFIIESHDSSDKRAQSYKCPKCSTADSDLVMYPVDDRETQIVTFSALSGKSNIVNEGNNGEKIISRNKHLDTTNTSCRGKKNYSYPEYGGLLNNSSNVASYHSISLEEKSLSACSRYGKSYNQQNNLDIHHKVHTEGKPFLCSQNGKHIGKKVPFISHQTTHTEYNQLNCLECGKCFKQRLSLIEHMRTHIGEERFPERGQSFTQHSTFSFLQKNHKVQKLFICFECGKCFRTKSDLTTHHRIHMGEKPFPCPECGEGFTRRANLVRHQRIHTGEKPFSCPYCGKCFTRKLGLMKHQNIHTEQKEFRKLHRKMFPHTMC